MSVTAVVPVWNGRELLGRLLASLEAQTQAAAELIVVDNGSTDGAPDHARARGARVIPMGRNMGFAAAVNRGIRESRTDWIAVLNSDVELARDYFERLTSHQGWFATGKILSARDPGSIDGTFDAICRGGTAWRIGAGRPNSGCFDSPRQIHSPPWTAALFRAALFEKIGVLEERFESYLEDVDFGLRCARAELTGAYDPTAIAWHAGSATLGRWHPETVRRIARNQIWLLARHYPDSLLLRQIWPILIAHLLWGGVAIRHGAMLAWLRGIFEGRRGFSGMRAHPGLSPQRMKDVLQAGERIIWEFQTSTGFDAYWRLYFLLTRGGA